MNRILTAQKRKGLIGVSGPIDYNPRALRKKFPTPILEAPIGLFLLFDEIWFLHPNLCPRNMQQLPYVHFLSEEMHLPELTELLREIPKAVASKGQCWERDAHKWYVKQRPNSRFIQPPSIELGSCRLNPSPFLLENLTLDSALATNFDFDLVTNFITNPTTSCLFEVRRETELTNFLLLRRIPNIYGKWGPYRPGLRELIDNLRESHLLRDFRKKISVACEENSGTPVTEIGLIIERELDRLVYTTFSKFFSQKQLYYSFANMVLGQIPIISNIVSVVLGISDFVQFYRNRTKCGWAGFIAYAGNLGNTILESHPKKHPNSGRPGRKLGNDISITQS